MADQNPLSVEKGFSLMEVLVFTTIFSLFFIVAASVVTTTLRITRENQDKIRSTHHIEELVEWIQSEKEINWGGTTNQGGLITSFTEQITRPGLTEVSFCFNSNPIPGWPSSGLTDCHFTLEGKYRRTATFSATLIEDSYVKQVNANVLVEWFEGEKLYSTPLKRTFSIWE